MVVIGSTVKERALTPRVRFAPILRAASPRKGGFPHELAVIDRHNDSLAARPASCSLGRMLEGMKSMAASPYGFWTSPITSDLVVADSIRLEQVALDGDAIYRTETQPQKQGRTFVYRDGADEEPERVTPDDANAFGVRTRAHEYGGGSFAVSEGVIYFSISISGSIARMRAGPRARSRLLQPEQLRMCSGTPMGSSTAGGSAWFASGRITLGQERRSRR